MNTSGDDLEETLRHALAPGYLIERELSGASVARIFVATEAALQRRVVIKVMPASMLENSTERFRREILTSASLQHPNIVPVLTAGEVAGNPWFSMPFVVGETLREQIRQRGALSPARCAALMLDVARALAYAHRMGFVHRDIKPENVMVHDGVALVLDFGVAKALATSREDEQAAHATGSGISVGTPAYMAPEQVGGDMEVDGRADLFALAAVGYELLTGHAPFARPTVTETLRATLGAAPPPIPARQIGGHAWLDALLMSCLAKKPADRPSSASAVVDVIERHLRRGSLDWWTPRRRALLVVASGVVGTIFFVQGVTRARLRDSAGTSVAAAAESFGLAEAEAARRTEPALARAIQLYERAIAADERYAVAWARLAEAYLALPYFRSDSVDTQARAVRAASRALALDSTLATAHAVLGSIRNSQWRWTEAARHLERAVQLDPHLARAHQWLGENQLLRGRADSAAAAFERAIGADATSATAHGLLGVTRALQGDPRRAREAAEEALMLGPGIAYLHVMQGTASLYLGQTAEAGESLELARTLAPRSPLVLGTLALLQYRIGDRAGAHASVQALEELRGVAGWHSAMSKVALGRGDLRGALTYLEEGVRVQDPIFASEPLWSPLFAPLHGLPEFRRLLAATNLERLSGSS